MCEYPMFLFSLCSRCLFSTATHRSHLGKLEEVEYLNLITQYEVNPIHISALSIIPIPFSCVPFCIVSSNCTHSSPFSLSPHLWCYREISAESRIQRRGRSNGMST